jgi:hypothetical protein
VTLEEPIPSPPQGDKDSGDKDSSVKSTVHSAGGSKVQPPPSHASYKISCEKNRDKWDYAKMVAEFIGLGFLIAYTLYTIGIYHSSVKSADAAHDATTTASETMRIDQRAWVYAIIGRAPIKIGQPLKPPIRIVNTGKTPAINMHGNIVVNLLGETEEPELSYPGHGHPSYAVNTRTLIPNLPQDMNDFAALPKHMTHEEPFWQVIVDSATKKAIEQGTSYLVIHGEIFYDDFFGVHHWIKFCSYEHNVVGAREHSVASTCGPYNSVDTNK